MSGDYSRIGFDPSQNYAGVQLQQGRPLTDRDWNEQTAAAGRRAQAGTLDADGRAMVSRVTPDAFKIASDGGASFTISPGRLYVDGLLADNHGTGAQKWDPLLAEMRGADPWPYAQQPYLPNAPALPAATTLLVYLDVWTREVTPTIAPALIEKALGVDTTTRTQTVWQVRALDPGAAIDCATPIDANAAWLAATAPSAGRLTTATAATAPDKDPCRVPPTAGYKGLENQLYRVEIHKMGALGAASFKWSRDNASVETRVSAIIDASHIVVASIGKDAILGFADGDWIEITDDGREFNGLAGDMHKIKIGGGVEASSRTITLESPLDTSYFPAGVVDDKRNIRIRRWDQKGKVLDKDGKLLVNLDASADGTIPISIAGQQILLEDGVLASFDVAQAGGEFHVGDYWCFAARASDASLEILTNAPPRGIHHHYLKLAVFTPPSGVENCRPATDAGCCCTKTVAPGEDIQAAIDTLPDSGGCVCLKAGLHAIDKPLSIANRSNVSLVGESAGAVVQSDSPDMLLLVDSADAIRVSSIHFRRSRPGAETPILAFVNATGAEALDCQIEDAQTKIAASSSGVFVIKCGSVRIARCRILWTQVGVAASGGDLLDLFVEENDILLSEGGSGATDPRLAGVIVQRAHGRCTIVGNDIAGGIAGVVINDDLTAAPQSEISDASISRNRILCAPTEKADASSTAAIDVAGTACIISDNVIALPSAAEAHVGVRIAGVGHRVLDNRIVAATESGGQVGIQIGVEGGETLTQGAQARGNMIAGFKVGVVSVSAINTLVDANNIEVEPRAGLFGVFLHANFAARILGNAIANGVSGVASSAGALSRIEDNGVANCAFGISVTQEFSPTIAKNRILAPSAFGVASTQIAGRCEIVENRMTNCGAIGVAAYLILGELRLDANEVTDTGITADGSATSGVAIGIAGLGVLEARVSGNLVTYSNVTKRPMGLEDRALWMMGFYDYRVEAPSGAQTLDESLGFAIQITDNKFIGTGRSALVELAQIKWNETKANAVTVSLYSRFERVIITGNYCLHYLGGAGTAASGVQLAFFAPAIKGATLTLCGRAAVVSSNQIRAAGPPLNAGDIGFFTQHAYPSVDYGGAPGPCFGNVLSGAIIDHGATPPLDGNFNMPF